MAYLVKSIEDGEVILDFEQLLTLLLVKAFEDRGLGLPTIKSAAARAQEVYKTPNPFVTKGFRSDGHHIFLDLNTAFGRGRELVNVLSDQREFHEIVEPSLFKDVVFIGDNAAERWLLGKDRHVVLMPGRQFGAPHVAGRGVRTDVVPQAVAAEDGGKQAVEAVAELYRLRFKEVADAVDFEGP